jgi:hypothetical protein
MNLIDLKERIATSDAFTQEERDFLLDAIDVMAVDVSCVHAPRGNPCRVNQLWAALSVYQGGEGLCATVMNGNYVPLVAADKQRLDIALPLARRIAMVTGTLTCTRCGPERSRRCTPTRARTSWSTWCRGS